MPMLCNKDGLSKRGSWMTNEELRRPRDPQYDPPHPFPCLGHLLGAHESEAMEALHNYVTPGGDYLFVRSQLDSLYEAFRQIEAHLARAWDGRGWWMR